jgi:hypothetical protein
MGERQREKATETERERGMTIEVAWIETLPFLELAASVAAVHCCYHHL